VDGGGVKKSDFLWTSVHKWMTPSVGNRGESNGSIILQFNILWQRIQGCPFENGRRSEN
jgi:hypothetical protein